MGSKLAVAQTKLIPSFDLSAIKRLILIK